MLLVARGRGGCGAPKPAGAGSRLRLRSGRTACATPDRRRISTLDVSSNDTDGAAALSSRSEWRRERDLNPRGGSTPPTRLAGEHFRPLSHPSGERGQVYAAAGVPSTPWIRSTHSTASRRCSSAGAPAGTRKRRSAAPPTRSATCPSTSCASSPSRDASRRSPASGRAAAASSTQALAGEVPEYLARLEAEAAPDVGARRRRSTPRSRGDLHLHSDWSDGGATDRGDGAQGRRARARLPRAHRPLAAAHDRARARRRAAARAARASSRGSTRSSRRSASSPASRSTSSTTAASTRTTTCSPSSTWSSPACTRSSAWREQPMTDRMVAAMANPQHRHPRALHRPPGASARAGPSRRSTPSWCSARARTSTRRSRSTAGPSASTRRCACSSSVVGDGCKVSIDSDAHAVGPARVAALRLRRAPPRPASTTDGSSTPGRSTGSSSGPLRTADRPTCPEQHAERSYSYAASRFAETARATRRVTPEVPSSVTRSEARSLRDRGATEEDRRPVLARARRLAGPHDLVRDLGARRLLHRRRCPLARHLLRAVGLPDHGLLLREWDAPRRGAHRSPRGSGRAGARRLLPALFVVLGAVLVYAAFVASPLGLDRVRGDVLGFAVLRRELAVHPVRPVVLLERSPRLRRCSTCGRSRSRSSSTCSGRRWCSACCGSRGDASSARRRGRRGRRGRDRSARSLPRC